MRARKTVIGRGRRITHTGDRQTFNLGPYESVLYLRSWRRFVLGVGLVDRFGHLAILEDNGKTVHYYYSEWKPKKPFTIDAQGRPVLTNRFDSGEDAIRELLRRGYQLPSKEDYARFSTGEYVGTSSTR